MAWDHVPAKSRWDDDAGIEQLRTLWALGYSTVEIGRQMGVTKNAIIGKSHRLGLPPRQSPIGLPTDVSEETKETARKLWADGQSGREISAVTGIPLWAFSRKRSWLNLPDHGPRKAALRPTLPPLPSVTVVEIVAPVVVQEAPAVSPRLKEVIAMKLPKPTPKPVASIGVKEWRQRGEIAVPTPEPATTFIARSGKCQWTDSEAWPWVFCGDATDGGSWCTCHRRIVFVRASAGIRVAEGKTMGPYREMPTAGRWAAE